jgi:hypothetical protein
MLIQYKTAHDLITYLLTLLMVFLRLSLFLLKVNPSATDTEV